MLQLIKLTTSEEILGDVLEEDSDHMLVYRPLKVIYQMRSVNRNPFVYLHQLTPFAEGDTITLPKQHVVYTADPKQDICEYYLEMNDQLIATEEQANQHIESESAGMEPLTEEEKEVLTNALLERMTVSSNTSVH